MIFVSFGLDRLVVLLVVVVVDRNLDFFSVERVRFRGVGENGIGGKKDIERTS
jgi:hypothetical protein